MLYDQFGHAILPRQISAAPRPKSMMDVFDSARRTGYKGMFYFPTLDIAEQMPEMTRDQIAGKINWCYNNIAPVPAVVNGLALDDVDTGVWPRPATTSPAFNAKVKDLWNQQCGFHKSFSANGENNFYSAQMAMRRAIYLGGDCFGAKLRAGEAAACPQLHLIPGWQVGNALTRLDQSQWRDGRRNNKFGRAMQYRVRTSNDGKQFSDYDSGDIIHFHDPFLIGQTRGMSMLSTVVRNLFSYDDIDKHETPAVLARSRVAYAIERQMGDEDGPTLLSGAREVQRVEDETTGTTLIVQTIETGDGGQVEIADLTDGKKLKVLESQKSSEAGAWMDRILRQIAFATLRPAEYIFGLAGLTQGTQVRMVQDRVQRVLNTIRDFQIILQLLEEWWPFWLWQNIKAGNLDDVRGGIPDRWWEYVVVRPRNLSVDRADGKLYDDRIAGGRMPSGLYVGMIYGEDHETFEDEIIRDQYRRRKRNREIAAELGEEEIPVEQIFRPPAGSTMPNIPVAAQQDE